MLVDGSTNRCLAVDVQRSLFDFIENILAGSIVQYGIIFKYLHL